MGVLLLLMTIVGVIAAFILLSISIFTKKNWLRKFVLGTGAAWFVFYAILLFAASLSSREKNLSLNEPKAFCGFYIDCHLHAAVSEVRKTKRLGEMTANGEFCIVKVRVSSDAKRAALGLLTVDVQIIDNQNRRFARDLLAEAQLGEQPPFERRISPVESFEKQIVFDLPADAENPRLDIREGYGVDHVIEAVLIGDEDSVLHKRNYFKLGEQTQSAGVKR